MPNFVLKALCTATMAFVSRTQAHKMPSAENSPFGVKVITLSSHNSTTPERLLTTAVKLSPNKS